MLRIVTSIHIFMLHSPRKRISLFFDCQRLHSEGHFTLNDVINDVMSYGKNGGEKEGNLKVRHREPKCEMAQGSLPFLRHLVEDSSKKGSSLAKTGTTLAFSNLFSCLSRSPSIAVGLSDYLSFLDASSGGEQVCYGLLL